MISKLMAFANDAVQQAGVLLHIPAHEEKRRGHLLGFEDVENLGSPLRVRPIVERERHLVSVAEALEIQCRERSGRSC